MLAEQTDHLAAWLTFAGVLLVAVIAAFTAQWRLRVQLRHERELADLSRLRQVLDEAAAAVEAAVEPTQLLIGRAHRYNPADQDAAAARADMKALCDEVHEAVRVIAVFFRRLALLMGRSDPLTLRLGSVQREFLDLQLEPPLEIAIANDIGSDQRHELLAAQLAGIRTVQFGFLDLAQKRAGIRGASRPLSKAEAHALAEQGLEIFEFQRDLGAGAGRPNSADPA
jgi:hypothetical protein